MGFFVSCQHWKWIYNLPRLQQTKSPHQNQRIYCFTCSSGFLCWFECCSFFFCMRRRWARLDAGCWWFISLLWSSWCLSTAHHLFFEISTRLFPDGLPLTLGAALLCTDLRWCACTRSSCWLHELIHVTVVYANIKSNSSFNRPVKCWQLHWRVCYSVRCSYFVVPRVPTSASCIAGAN